MANFPRRDQHQQKREEEVEEPASKEFTSFEDILDVDDDQIDRPKPTPQGSYEGMIDGLPEYGRSSKKGTPFIQWNVKLLGPKEDVNLDDLQAAGGVNNKWVKVNIWLPNGKEDRYKIKEFCDKCGIPQGNLQQRVDQTPNCRIGVSIKHDIQDDGTVFATARKVFSVVND